MSGALPARARIAPSPTGDPHVGTAYTALFNRALAQQTGGQFVLRIEDTDRERYLAESEQRVFDYLRWLGLDWDEGPDVGGPYGPYRQSERLDVYRAHAETLISQSSAYWCWCSRERLDSLRKEQTARGEPPKYDRLCLGLSRDERSRLEGFSEPPVLRLRVPEGGETSFVDLIRGPIQFQNSTVDDQVLLKSDGYPTYHLAVVVDDHEMRITHVMRGEEWISSTPKHVLLYQAFEWELPAFAHLPILRNADRSKISKRKNPWAVLPWFREQGFLPEALVNFLALMGFSIPGEDDPNATQEIFDVDDVARYFSFDRFSTTSPVFDLDKLDWMNGVYIRRLPVAELTKRVEPFLRDAGLIEPGIDSAYLESCVGLEQERFKRLSEAPEALRFFLVESLDYEVELLIPKAWDAEQSKRALTETLESLRTLDRFDEQTLQTTIRGLAGARSWKTSPYFMLLRVAITGRTASPPLFDTMAVLGRDRVTQRMAAALRRLNSAR